MLIKHLTPKESDFEIESHGSLEIPREPIVIYNGAKEKVDLNCDLSIRFYIHYFTKGEGFHYSEDDVYLSQH